MKLTASWILQKFEEYRKSDGSEFTGLAAFYAES